LQLVEESLELVEIGAKLVHLAQCARDLGKRAGRIGCERLEPPLRALELAAQNQHARPTLLGKLPQPGLRDGLVVDDSAEPFLQRGVERLDDRVTPCRRLWPADEVRAGRSGPVSCRSRGEDPRPSRIDPQVGSCHRRQRSAQTVTVAAGDCAFINGIADGTSVVVAETLASSLRVFSIACNPGCSNIDLNGGTATIPIKRNTDAVLTFTNESTL
jgi:hypothetical protein